VAFFINSKFKRMANCAAAKEKGRRGQKTKDEDQREEYEQ